MRIFGYDIKFQRNATRGSRFFSVDYFQPMTERLVFSQSELLNCEKMIADRLSNAVFTFARNNNDSPTERNIVKWLQGNRLQYVQRMFIDGYVVVNIYTMSFVDVRSRGIYRGADSKFCLDLHENEVAQTSQTFEATGKSDYEFLKDKLRFLDSVNSSDFNLIENYGAMGIVSPESDNSVAGAMFDEKEISEMQDNYRAHYGIKFGKWSLMFVPRPTKYSPIQLPIAQLQLNEKRLYAIKAVFAALNIPKELSVYFDNSTFENRKQAELDMYGNCVSAWAREMCKLGMLIYRRLNELNGYLVKDNELYFDFKGVLALQEESEKEKVAAREELAFWEEILSKYPDKREVAEQRINDLIENL